MERDTVCNDRKVFLNNLRSYLLIRTWPFTYPLNYVLGSPVGPVKLVPTTREETLVGSHENYRVGETTGVTVWLPSLGRITSEISYLVFTLVHLRPFHKNR